MHSAPTKLEIEMPTDCQLHLHRNLAASFWHRLQNFVALVIHMSTLSLNGTEIHSMVSCTWLTLLLCKAVLIGIQAIV